MYALVVFVKEAKSTDGTIIASAGQGFLVTEERERWVEATSTPLRWALQNYGAFPGDLKIFDTKESAEEFAKRWGGYPWWCQPNGKFEIVEVKPKYKQVQVGYERV